MLRGSSYGSLVVAASLVAACGKLQAEYADGDDAGTHAPDAASSTDAADADLPEPTGDGMQLAVGDGTSCVLTETGKTYCWGVDPPTHRPELDGLSTISLGSNFGCGQRSDSSVVCWGQNYQGQLGLGTMDSDWHEPTPVPGLEATISVRVNHSSACAILHDQRVVCWGANEFGQAGDTVPALSPVLVPLLQEVVAIAPGRYHVCALRSDKTVWCWGQGGSGQLGNGTSTMQTSEPEQATGLENVQSIDSGWYWSCATFADGALLCWGANFFGQLGLPADLWDSNFHYSTPMLVPDVENVAKVSGGGGHTCALREDASLLCWGQPAFGALGNGDDAPYENAATPPGLVPISNVVQVDLARARSCALRGGGTVWCWGERGSLGDGTLENSATPKQVVW